MPDRVKPFRTPIRLLGEILALIVVAQAAVMVVLPMLDHGIGDLSRIALSAALLVLLAGPAVYWRCMVDARRGSVESGARQLGTGSVASAIAMTAAAQAIGLALTAACVVWQQRNIAASAQQSFDRGAERIQTETNRHFTLPLTTLNGLRAAFAATGELTRREFQMWVETRDLPVEVPGVRSIGFIQRVERSDLPRFIAAERADGAPDFNVRSTGDAPDLYVIKYTGPLALSRAAVGLDIGRESIRREAAERAVRTDWPSLSGSITLAGEEARGPAFLYFVPYYGSSTERALPQPRQASRVGLLYATIVAKEIMAGVSDVADGVLDIELFDGEAAQRDRRVFASRPAEPAAAAAPDRAEPGPAFQSVRAFDVGGRKLVLRVSSSPGFEAAIDRSSVVFIAVGGVLASFLMAMAVWLLAVGRVRAQRRAERMTADLARLARVVQVTSSSVAITDRQLRINWVNAGFTRLTGYTLEEAAGRTPGELLGHSEVDPQTIEAVAAAVAAGVPVRVELLNRAKDGGEYWIDTEIQPTRDDKGVLTGFMEVGADVTPQKEAHLRLEAAMRENDALLRAINQHAIVSVVDREGRISDVNDAFCRISGYSRQELLGHSHRVVNSGVHGAAFWREMWRTIASGAPWRGDICNRARDGSLFWVDSMIAPFVGADGGIEKYVSIRTDITASKAAHQALSDMAHRLGLAIEGGSDGLWDWMDVNADAQWWSPSFYALLGSQATGLPAGRASFASLLHPSHRAGFEQAVEQALTRCEPLEMEFLLRTGESDYRWFFARAKVYVDAAGQATRMAGSMQDIDDRRRAERDLARERQRLVQILEGTNVGTWEWNVETGETHFDERWAEIGGHTLEELGPTTIQTWTENTHPDDRSRSALLLQQHFSGELPYYECETRMQHPAEHWVWVLDRGKLFARSDVGGPRWMAGTRMDISQRKQAEQALRASEAFLDRAGRIAGVGGWMIDLGSGAITWSDQTCRIHDLEPGYQPSMDEATSFYTPVSRPIIEAAVQDAIEHGRSWDLELPFITAKGRSVWVRSVGEVECEDGKTMRLIGAFQDVTDRRALNEERRRSNELMVGVLENLPCGLSVFDGDLRLVTHNSQFRQLLNLPDAMFDRCEATFDQFVRLSATRGEYADDERGNGEVEDIVAGIIRRARQPVVHSFERVVPHGTPLEVRRAPMPGGGFITTYTDISTRKQAEVQLKAALSQAEQASLTKSQFLANMSHEIRTPMNAILGMLTLLHKTPLTARQLDYATKSEGAARSLLGLLNDILDFSKAEAGKMALDPRPFRIDHLLRDLSVILSASIGPKPLEVLFDIDPAVPPLLLGDDMRLQQVLINLGGNAIKFTAVGEVVLSLRVLQRTAADVLLEFAVRDTGIGIATENQAHIFTGFSQAEASTTRRFGGTGLGLAICQRLVALMGGDLRLDSTPGQGSTFFFQIRLALAEPPAEVIDLPPPLPAVVRALIVDDNALVRKLFLIMARSLGWQADAMSSGAEGIAETAARAAAGTPYDAVFVDWQMPELDGWETARRIQQLPQLGTQPAPLIFMVTGHGPETLVSRSAEEQALLSGFLVKPVTAAMLRQAISDARAALDRRERLPIAPAQATRRLAGMRLLVVEDNLNNQQVAQELLSDEGAHVTLASDGQLGVDAVAAADPPFDAVLMDVQMPVMDGYIATARIRQLGRTALPIIAMTANAMAADRAASLAAGMNDHVGKPYDLSDLVATLLRHTGRSAVPRAIAAPAPPAPPAPSAAPAAFAVPTAVLEEAARHGVALAPALRRMGGNSRIYLRLLRRFQDDVAALPERLDALLQQGQVDPAGALMHTFKGLAGTLGIEPLAAWASDAEGRLRDGASTVDHATLIEPLRALVAVTLNDVACVAQALEQATAEPEASGAAAPADLPGLRRALEELCVLLRSSDMQALERFEQLQQVHGAHFPEALAPLGRAMAELDFEQALLLCRALQPGVAP